MHQHSVKGVSLLSSIFKTLPMNCKLPRHWLNPAFKELTWKFRSWEIATPGGKLYWSIALWLLCWGASWCWHGLLNFCEQYIHKMAGLWINQEGSLQLWNFGQNQRCKWWRKEDFPARDFCSFFLTRVFLLICSVSYLRWTSLNPVIDNDKDPRCVDSFDWGPLSVQGPRIWKMLNSLAFKN